MQPRFERPTSQRPSAPVSSPPCGARIAEAWTAARASLAVLASLPYGPEDDVAWLPCVEELPEVPTC
jgi:hypothetical protein